MFGKTYRASSTEYHNYNKLMDRYNKSNLDAPDI